MMRFRGKIFDSTLRGRNAVLLLLALAGTLAAQPAAANASWASRDSGTTADLDDVFCGTDATCVAVGTAGTILTTANGGLTWTQEASGTTADLSGVSCPTPLRCYVVAADDGDGGDVLATTDGGSTWTNKLSGTNTLQAIDCPSDDKCYAVGYSRIIVATTNGGSTWTTQFTSGNGDAFYDISCPSVSVCYAAGIAYANPGSVGSVSKTTNGGSTWTSQAFDPNDSFYSISCPSVSTCYAIDSAGDSAITKNGGSTWTSGPLPTASSGVYDISCISVTTCYAVSTDEAVVTRDGGSSWTVEPLLPALPSGDYPNSISCPSGATCWVVGDGGAMYRRQADSPDEIVPPPRDPFEAPSESCTDPDAKVADGYAGDGTYVKLRIQRNDGENTLVCVRTRSASGPNFGGRFVVTDGGAGVSPGTPTTDLESGSCANAGNELAGPHPLLDGQVGAPSQPVYVPYMLDSYGTPGEAWVCLEVGSVKARVVIPVPEAGGAPPMVAFQADDPLPASPPPTVDPYPSGACQSGVGGEKRQVLNSDLGDAHAWLYSWRPNGTSAKLCVRAETQGGLAVGGVLSVDATGLPGVTVTPIYEVVDGDTDECSWVVIQNDSPTKLYVTHSPPGVNPASVCVETADTKKRATAGFAVSGSPTQPSVTWAPDPGTPGLP